MLVASAMVIRLPEGRFGGEPIGGRRVDGLRLTETTYAPELELPRHAHELACFVVVLDGVFDEAFGRRARDCGPLSLIFRPAGEVHSDRFRRAGARCLNVEVEPAWLERVRRCSAVLDDSAEFRGAAFAWLGVKLAREFRLADDVSSLAIESCVLEIVAAAARERARPAGGRARPWLERAREYLATHYAEGVTVADVAGEVGVHPAHLARAFRAHAGCTIGDYVRRLRVAFASRELAATERPLAEVGHAAGFCDQGHFTRAFKRQTGLTPAEFRRSARER
jgi:AraC family transcriptional regulator